MALVIRLLGRPEIERDGVVTEPPRGHKSWAVLAYVLLAGQATSRARLASLIFAGADDPLGALRWTLAQLRRALGAPAALQGDPLTLGVAATVDVLTLEGDEPEWALARGELLEGVDAGTGEVFDAWLLVERQRAAGLCEAVLHDAAHAALAAGRPLDGARLASRVLVFNPFDENAHELLVRCLARAGEARAAREQAASCEALFRRELGRFPDPRVRRAADAQEEVRGGDRAAAVGQLDAGRAAVDAGAVEPGVACLRLACAEARGVGDPALLARALAALGTALVHAIRGYDEEGAAVLHEALALAEASGQREVAAKTCRELGFVEVQAGRGASTGRWLARATALADESSERAAILGVRGMALSDRAHYPAAIELLTQSVAIAQVCGDEQQTAWSFALLGRALLLRGELSDAAAALDSSLALVETTGWIAFQPLPEAVRAELALRQGDPERAATLVEHAFSLGCRLGDPCWEAIAARVRGLVYETTGDRRAALAWLRDAVERAVRVADPYRWIHAYCLDALAALAIAAGEPDARLVADELARVAAHGDMRELVVRAALHRAALGEPGAAASARLLGEAIDNPLLHELLASHAPSHGALMQ